VSLLELLQSCDFLRPIPVKLVEKLSQFAEERCYAAGTPLFTEGAAHHEFHILLEGHVRLDMHVPNRGRVPILSAGPGDVLAWSSLVGNAIMTSTGVALVDVRTITLPSNSLISLCESEPEIGFHVMRQLASALSRRLVATRLQLLDLYESERTKALAGFDFPDQVQQEFKVTQSFAKSVE
jgi:CRP-like cAMP-binding protein